MALSFVCPPTTLTAEGLPYKYSIKRKDDNTVEIYAEPIKAGEKPVANGETIKLDSKKE